MPNSECASGSQPHLPGVQRVAGWEDEKQCSPGVGRHRKVVRVTCMAGHLPELLPISRGGGGSPGLHGSPLPGLGGKTSVT